MLKQKSVKKQITVFIAFIIKNKKVLMVQRTEKECPEAHFKWEFPGGKANFNETPKQAVIRETFEETGVKIKVSSLIPYIQVNYWNYPWGIQQTFVFCYSAKYISGKIQSADHHVKKLEWMPLKKLNEKDLLPGIKEFIQFSAKNH